MDVDRARRPGFGSSALVPDRGVVEMHHAFFGLVIRTRGADPLYPFITDPALAG